MVKGEKNMASPQKTEQQVEQSHDNIDLRGTFVSVLIVGAVIATSWLGVWYLFISR